MNDLVNTFLGALWRGGAWGYYWAKNGKRSQWTTTAPIQDCVMGHTDIYFGIHPGKTDRGTAARNRIEDVAAVSCMFCEYDAKDQLWGGDMAKIRDHIKGLIIQPSVITMSGGGYHCWWLTDEPFQLTTEAATDYIKEIQAYWVTAMLGDPGAKDLARVLRLPGTLNAKYTPAREVTFVRTNFDARYPLADMCSIAEDTWRNPPPPPAILQSQPASSIKYTRTDDENVIADYNASIKITDQLRKYGYTIQGDKFIRPNKDAKLGESGTIDVTKNCAFTFSSNDPMYNASDLSKSSAGNGFDPFDMFARFEYAGDKKAAVKFLYQEIKKYERQQATSR